MSSPFPCFPNYTRWGTKSGGFYKATGSISITPSSSITSDRTNGIIGSIRWTNTDYAVVVQSFGFQFLTTTGFASADRIGMTAYKVTNYTAVDTGGTNVTSSFSAPTLSGMPVSKVDSVVICSGATAAMTAGTRTLGNAIYSSQSMVGTGSGTLQPGTIYQFKWNDDEPTILLANEGIEYQIPYGLTLPANKNLIVNVITSWAEVPREIIFDRYGI